MTDLYRQYRPTTFKAVVGQGEAIAVLQKIAKDEKNRPHAILFSGPSGCGKTTLARILCAKIGCHANDLIEMDSASFRGIDSMREIRGRVGLSPTNGKVRVWLLDELHQMTRDAQNAFLKLLEEPPRHVFFFLATTDPGKLLPTIRTRCTEIKLQRILASDLVTAVKRIEAKEGKELSEDVRDKLVEVADGSARKAIVLLNQIIDLEDEEEQMAVLSSPDAEKQAIDIARALLKPHTKWPEVAGLLKECKEEAEDIRRLILGYATSVLLGGGKLAGRAFFLIEAFRDNFYDSGRAGLAAACYEVFQQK